MGKDVLRPNFLVFDLDPGPPANIVQCCQVGVWVRDIFASLKLQSFAKTSGSKGLQIYVPLNTAVTYDQTKSFAHEVARLLERQHPQMVVSDMKKSLRTNKILVDWSQNDDHKTTVCVYSLRAKERPTASTPVKWEEVENCLEKGDPSLLVFEAGEVLERAKKYGDLFAPVLKLKQKMPPLEALQGMKAGGAAAVVGPVKPQRREEVSSRAASAKAKRTSSKKASTVPKKR
jgi:bifunctional non-homologous end joining protein LigD